MFHKYLYSRQFATDIWSADAARYASLVYRAGILLIQWHNSCFPGNSSSDSLLSLAAIFHALLFITLFPLVFFFFPLRVCFFYFTFLILNRLPGLDSHNVKQIPERQLHIFLQKGTTIKSIPPPSSSNCMYVHQKLCRVKSVTLLNTRHVYCCSILHIVRAENHFLISFSKR